MDWDVLSFWPCCFAEDRADLRQLQRVVLGRLGVFDADLPDVWWMINFDCFHHRGQDTSQLYGRGLCGSVFFSMRRVVVAGHWWHCDAANHRNYRLHIKWSRLFSGNVCSAFTSISRLLPQRRYLGTLRLISIRRFPNFAWAILIFDPDRLLLLLSISRTNFLPRRRLSIHGRNIFNILIDKIGLIWSSNPGRPVTYRLLQYIRMVLPWLYHGELKCITYNWLVFNSLLFHAVYVIFGKLYFW